MRDGARYHVARGKLGQLMILGHEANHLHVAQAGAFTAQRFGDKKARRSFYIQSGGMELNKLHIAELGAGAKRHSYAVTGGDRRIGGLAKDLAQASSRQEDAAGTDAMRVAALVHQLYTENLAAVQAKLSSELEVAKGNVLELASLGLKRARDLASGGIALGVQHARPAMRALASKAELGLVSVEAGAPFHKLVYSQRPLFHQQLGSFHVA